MANYSKQVASLAEKYGINTDTNEVFKKLMETFDNKTNYQLWALKSVFEGKATLQNILHFAIWAEANHSLISKLSKKNLTAYNSSNDFKILAKEIDTLNKIGTIKKIISFFNTAQKKMLTEHIGVNLFTSLDGSNKMLCDSYDLLTKFNRLPKYRKDKFISLASAYTNINSLIDGIKNCLNMTYSWDKDEFLSFLSFSVKKECEIVYNEGNIVIVRVPDFDTSKLLCGGGRTGWCLTRESQYFRNYVTSQPNRSQYFLFNFGKPESDDMSHVGFTVDPSIGITNAHSTKNHNMLGSGVEYRGKRVSISSLLSTLGIDMGLFLRLKGNAPFDWNLTSFLEYAKGKENMVICYTHDNRVIVKITSDNMARTLLSHTYIPLRAIRLNNASSDSLQYVLFDFNLRYNAENSIIGMYYTKDRFNTEHMSSMENAYNKVLTDTDYLKTIGIVESDYLSNVEIDPSLLLHKLIEENREDEAIKLINDKKDEVDVNYSFEENLPIYNAINRKMVKLFSVLINNPKFDSNVLDGFENTILGTLIYLWRTPEFIKSKEDEQCIRTMITETIHAKNYDINGVDCVMDSPLSISCENVKSLWVTEELVKDPRVDVNLKNDFGNTALDIALTEANKGAVNALLTRPDLVISSENKIMMKKIGIDVKKITPSLVAAK